MENATEIRRGIGLTKDALQKLKKVLNTYIFCRHNGKSIGLLYNIHPVISKGDRWRHIPDELERVDDRTEV